MVNNNMLKYIDHFIKNNNKISANEICTYLIENHAFSNKAYSTGRPKIYCDVVTHLEFLLLSKHLVEVKRDRKDCVYEVLNAHAVPVVKNTLEIGKPEEETDEEFQLTLFD